MGFLGEDPRKSSSPTSASSFLVPRAHPENYDTGGISSACGDGSHPGGRWGCPMWQGAAGEGASPGQRQLGTDSALVSSGLCLELSWPDFSVSCLPAPPSSKSQSEDRASLCARSMAGGQPSGWGYRETWLWGQEGGEALRLDHRSLEGCPQRASSSQCHPIFLQLMTKDTPDALSLETYGNFDNQVKGWGPGQGPDPITDY